MPSRRCEQSPREAPGVLTVLDDEACVDEHVLDARRVLVGLLVRRAIGDAARVEHHEVGFRPDRDDTPVFEPEAARRERRHLVNCLWQRQHALLARVLPQHAREGTVTPGVRLARGQLTVRRERRAVGADHHRRVHKGPPQVALVELEKDHGPLAALGNDQLQRVHEATMMFSHPMRSSRPGPVAGASTSRRMRARTSGSARRVSMASIPPSRAQSGRSVRSVVLDAVYGYTSAMTSSPSARAASTSSSASATLPQFGRPAAFTWLICTGRSPSRPTWIASRTASSSVAPSPRMWLA